MSETERTDAEIAAKISKARIKALYRRQEAYLSSTDALKFGFVDAIR